MNTNNELSILANTVIWAAGIKAVNFQGLEKATIERGGRYRVDAYNKLEGYENIYAIGDVSIHLDNPDWPRGYPQVAPAAIQMGSALGNNLHKLEKGAPLEPFKYLDKGTMATIGRNKAVLDLGKLHLKGWIAWMGWMFVHIFYLIGFRNKVVVFINWVWSYFTYDKGNRLIIRPFRRKQAFKPTKEVEVAN